MDGPYTVKALADDVLPLLAAIQEEVRALRARLEEVFPKAETDEEKRSAAYDASLTWFQRHGNTTAVSSATRIEPRPIRDNEPTSC